MLDIIGCRIDSPPLCYPTTKRLKYTELANLAVVWFGCGTWPLKLREVYRLRVFENV
jgi:hypothetical protein